MENVEMKTTVPQRGLRLLHKANLMAVIATILAIISGITVVITAGVGLGTAMENGTASGGMMAVGVISALVTVGSVIFVLVAGVIEIVALFKLSPIHAGYKFALIWVIVSLVASLIVSIPTLFENGATLPWYQTFSKVWEIAPPIFGLLKVYFVLGATAAILTDKGDMTVAAKGVAVRKIYIICTIVIVVAELGAFVPALVGFASFVTIVTSVVQLVALFKYIGFLGDAVKVLEA
ncbi:MAG: hypothetical protein RSD28_08405 [Lachnospiraceae bacterium]